MGWINKGAICMCQICWTYRNPSVTYVIIATCLPSMADSDGEESVSGDLGARAASVAIATIREQIMLP